LFVDTKAEAATIRTAFEQRSELSAAVESRRLFPADTVRTSECTRTLQG
jgi:hypothetical protein